MDWGKIFSNIKYEFKKNSELFHDAETAEEQKQAINGFIKAINYLQQVLQGDVPDFYRSPLQNQLQISRDELAIMEKNVGNLSKKALVEGGGKAKPNEKEQETRAQGLLDTIIAEKPNVKWEDIAGLNEAKKALHEALIMPIKYPDFFVGNVKPWKGILLYGPPGTGKTFIAKACATECESTFFSVSSSDLMSKYMGESEKMIKELFRIANEKAPSIIFIDEIDSMCGNRSDNDSDNSKRVKTEFLVQMQGVGSNNEKVLVLGATNLPWALDPAVRRRFERRVLIPLPDMEARMYLIRNKLKGLDMNLSDKDIEFIASKTDGYSGSDLEIFCRDAAFEPLHMAQRTNKFKKIIHEGRQKYMPVPPNYNGGDCITSTVYELPNNALVLPDLTRQDLEAALTRSKSSVSKGDLKEYEEWTKQFGVSD
jgi:vacuolar protein-sorting-associated protein 4